MAEGQRRPTAVVLAAGEGTRMRSRIPKVLHEANGRPLLAYVLDALAPLHLDVVVVVSRRGDEVSAAMARAGHPDGVRYVVQDPPRGTADAVRTVLDELAGLHGAVLVLPGDGPLIRTDTLKSLLETHERLQTGATMLTAMMRDPSGYGRVVRGAAGIERVVEERDCTPEERMIDEVNAGVYVFEATALRKTLPRVGTGNAQREYYLTDVVALLRAAGGEVAGLPVDETEAAGVNSQSDLAEVAALLRRRACERWMARGVTVVDPATTYIDARVEIAPGARVLPFTFLEGETHIGPDAEIGPMSRLVDTVVHDGATITFSVVRGSEIGPDASVGPYASLRAGTKLGRGARIGTFVETKQATIGDGSKAPHLSYLGDAEIGRGVNIGAGTITCNWDGRSKHRTVIEDDAYISSDTMLVAPTRIGKRAATGAGAVVRGDVPEDSLAVGVPARVLEGRGDRMGRRAASADADADAGGETQ